MKTALVALALATSGAYALPPVGAMNMIAEQAQSSANVEQAGLGEFLENLFNPVFDQTPVDPIMEAERQENLRKAKTFEEAMQFMTPDEIAQEYGIPTDFAADQDASLMLNYASGSGYLKINVSIAAQTLSMEGSDTPLFREVVSTGKAGHGTVRGCFHPTVLSPNHWSKKYNSPMPWAVFFYGGFALHQTPYVKQLGTKASHGCVRQSGPNAKHVYETVAWYKKTYGNGSITICVQ